MNLKKWKGTDK